jgi:hypothetical protein
MRSSLSCTVRFASPYSERRVLDDGATSPVALQVSPPLAQAMARAATVIASTCTALCCGYAALFQQTLCLLVVIAARVKG